LLRNSFWRFDRGLIEVFNLFREHPSLIALSGCALLSVAVPPGFGRNAPGRYVIIRTDFAPPKLVATTWRKVADMELWRELRGRGYRGSYESLNNYLHRQNYLRQL
jgi:hypothetical protein